MRFIWEVSQGDPVSLYQERLEDFSAYEGPFVNSRPGKPVWLIARNPDSIT